MPAVWDQLRPEPRTALVAAQLAVSLSLLGSRRRVSRLNKRPTQIRSREKLGSTTPIAKFPQHTGRNTQRPQKVKMTIVFRANDTGAASLAPIKRKRPRNVFQGPLGELATERLRR
jgi:hypothetical protein